MDNYKIISEMTSIGIAKQDAVVIADCIITQKSCSWVNNEPVNQEMFKNLLTLIEENNYGIKENVEPIRTRNKYIWDVKAIQK